MSIATEITRLQTAKADLKTSIESKGVTVPSTTKLDGYPALVDSIITGTITGLVYETGTWTPSEDVNSYIIPFSNTHSSAPFFYAIADATGTIAGTTYSNYVTEYLNFEQIFGERIIASDSSIYYGVSRRMYTSTYATAIYNTTGAITKSINDTGNSYSNYPRYWATETGIKAFTENNSCYWRTGRTYKWIAVWTPTT